MLTPGHFALNWMVFFTLTGTATEKIINVGVQFVIALVKEPLDLASY
jgi:hypothetical protein